MKALLACADLFLGTTLLPADGVYTIRVYLMRNAARRNETANYTLEVRIAGGGRQLL
jgi:hypothetical protein